MRSNEYNAKGDKNSGFTYDNRFSEATRPEGLEPSTYGLEIRCSIRLSYGRRYFSVQLARVWIIAAHGWHRKYSGTLSYAVGARWGRLHAVAKLRRKGRLGFCDILSLLCHKTCDRNIASSNT
jgi:hypothetical protein